MMSESENLIVDTTTRLFQDLADPQTINLANGPQWRVPLWAALEEMGLTRTWVPDSLGGAGAGVMDGFEVLRVAGAFAATVPLAETLLAGWALTSAGLETPLGMLSVVPSGPAPSVTLGPNQVLQGRAERVPFAREVDHLVVECSGEGGTDIALVARGACAVTPGENLAKEPMDTVDFTGVTPLAIAPARADAVDLMHVGATVRAMQMAGALQAVLTMCVDYSSERVAFERPIGKFQAVQHNLARLAGEVAAANASANSAAYSLELHGGYNDGLFFDIASAKIRVGEAANAGAMIAHQTHGAIGFTQEHILHRFTHRLWSWRDTFGDENYWALRLGNHVAGVGADGLWPTLTSL
ncbi:MAG: acyl-CoA dehydrogenase [Gammaproteobacteria bacterium]|jgi:acyl-CoA dehydrogenase